MTRATLILAATLLASCGAPQHDAAFDKYRDAFYQDAKDHGVENLRLIPIAFGHDIADGVMAICSAYGHILAKADRWQTASPRQRRSVIYHELGHCALSLDHDDGVLMDIALKFTSDETEWAEWVTEMFDIYKEKAQ